MPVFGPIFQSYDADRYADFSCATCHPGAEAYDFEMPALFPLDWSNADYWAAEGIYVGDGSGFMEVVTSTMVGVLDEEPYNPETGAGFGCYSCHQP